ncbi:hypothetical protein CMO83_03855 [Candidatus Woesearchaeota archaeon]|jgi:hypothetical protein|nr:hypothetical protein [Candidatus Woesearchaeota archaeon]MAG91784.1 hypothetical protein [Candidatus Woesearchaeota archaeon]|tara:strand:+ start:27266 stop:27505 length:240 start_codon:yes stop_codon:yes gene_type:complete
MKQTDPDTLAIAELLHSTLLERYSPGQELGLTTVKEEAAVIVRDLEATCNVVSVLLAMQCSGYVARHGMGYVLQPLSQG